MSSDAARFWNQVPLAESAFPAKYGPKFRCRTRAKTAAGPVALTRLFYPLRFPSSEAHPSPCNNLLLDFGGSRFLVRMIRVPAPAPESRPPRLVELGVDRASRLRRHPGHAFE